MGFYVLLLYVEGFEKAQTVKTYFYVYDVTILQHGCRVYIAFRAVYCLQGSCSENI